MAAGPWRGRKLDLWALPYARVLFLDLDLMLLPAAGAHLRRVWNATLGPRGLRALPATHHDPPQCFNSGMMLLAPSRDTFARVEAAVVGDAGYEPCPVGACFSPDGRRACA